VHVWRLTGGPPRQAARLPPPQGTVVYSVSSMDEIGEALDERLGQMCRRPHWTKH
jgi:hypothetical protein